MFYIIIHSGSGAGMIECETAEQVKEQLRSVHECEGVSPYTVIEGFEAPFQELLKSNVATP